MAAADLKSKKRKSAADAAPKPKKQKKSDATAAAPKKSTKALKAAVEPIDSLSANVKPARRQDEVFISGSEAPVKEKKPKKSKAAAAVNGDKDAAVNAKLDTSKAKEKPGKKGKKGQVPDAEAAPAPEAPKKKSQKSKKGRQSDKAEAVPLVEVITTVTEVEQPAPAKDKKSKKAKKSKAKEEPKGEVAEAIAEANGAEDDEDVDDQTAALLAGFESEGDEEDLGKEDEDIGEDVANTPQLSKKARKQLEIAAKKDEPGVIFLGRIPHGFFEPQMKQYFSQFGHVTRLRLSRNKKTGASKHYAFIEFASAEVADIVAKTMDKYLMFGHILQCRRVHAEQVHPELFKGANQRFKVDPRNKKAGLAMERGAERAQWEKRIEKESERRAEKAKELKDEFDYEYTAPALKAVEDVPRKAPAIEGGAAQQLLTEAVAAEEATEVVQVIESTPDQLSVTDTVKVKKPKEGAKGKRQTKPVANEVTEQSEPVQAEKKGKKVKKQNFDAVVEANEEAKDIPVEPSTSKPKKAKKETLKADEDTVKEKKRKAKSADQDVTKPKKAKKAKA